ncbi:MAG: adenine deaminase [Peptococcaceae bacterium]|jgi:adenine deaminase|nr:adenine deaminase [Peptococcaceae bacterium]
MSYEDGNLARGLAPVDLVLRGGRLVNVLSGEIQSGVDVGIAGGRFAGIGRFEGAATMELDGAYIVPGLIDAHVHMESSLVAPAAFWSVLLAHGVTSAVVDPHEIANVLGTEGLSYVLQATAEVPANCFVALPSCVPSSPWETAGARLSALELAPFAGHPRVVALGEVMNFPAVLAGDPEMAAKLDLPLQVRDGHAPGMSPMDLNAYCLAGIGTDHECVSAAEAAERLARGIKVLLREGGAAKNLLDLLPAVNEFNARRCLLATDDRHADDLLDQGSIDHLVRLALAAGQPPVRVIQMATLNPAETYGLTGLGAVAPGWQADFLLVSDLNRFVIEEVYHRGRLVSRGGELARVDPYAGRVPTGTVGLGAWSLDKLRVRARGPVNVIGVQKGQLWTDWLTRDLPVDAEGSLLADPGRNIVKLAVCERHHDTGRVGVGFVEGLGLKRGALASTVAHDAHNLVVAGVDDRDMDLAVRTLAACGGGLAVVGGEEVLGLLPLPLAGLMSMEDVPAVAAKLKELRKAAAGLGVPPGGDPFMTLSFLALPVIPRLKLTDLGLVDVEGNRLAGLTAGGGPKRTV